MAQDTKGNTNIRRFDVMDAETGNVFSFYDTQNLGPDYWFEAWHNLHGWKYVDPRTKTTGVQLYLDLPLEWGYDNACVHGYPSWHMCEACVRELRWSNE